MELTPLILLAGMSVFVGVLIGTVGIGGVLLVPILTYILSFDVHVAVAAAMFSYLFSGVMGTIIYAGKRSIRWNMAFWVFASAAPAAFLGAYALSIIPGDALKLVIAALVIFAGVNALLAKEDGAKEAPPLTPGVLIANGTVTGFGAALSGTGGPLILVPLLVWMGQPALVAVGLSQAVQVPVALMATAGNYLYGTVDFLIGGVIAAGLIVGVNGGARLAHIVPHAVLQRIVAWVLVTVGIFMIVRIALDVFFS